jgi:hypothetical protein
MSTGEPDATEIGHVRFGKGSSEKELQHSHLAGDLLHCTPGSGGDPEKPTSGNAGRALRVDLTVTEWR